MKNVKFIAVDLDGTLLDSGGKLSKQNRDAIEAAIAKGIHVVIASGRPLGSLPLEVLDVKGIEYAITSNGAAIYHLPTKKRVHGFLLDQDSVEKILGIAKETGVVLETFIDGVAYADKRYVEDPVRHGALDRAVSYIQRTRNPIEDMEQFVENHIEELDSIDLVVKKPKMKKEIESLLSNVGDIYITSSLKQLIEISHKDAGKHTGMKFLGELLGIASEEMAAIGNDRNDIDMMRFAGCGIAVANASKECMDVADVIVRGNDEDGAAEAIYKIIKK